MLLTIAIKIIITHSIRKYLDQYLVNFLRMILNKPSYCLSGAVIEHATAVLWSRLDSQVK